MAAAEGMVEVELPGRAWRHPGPQRRAAGRLGRRDDGGRRPADDRRPGPRAREVPGQPARRRLLHDPAAAARGGEPLRVHRAPGPVHRRHQGRRRGRRGRVQGARHPPRPGPRLPGPRRGRQHHRLHRHRRGPGRLRAHLRRAARRHRRLGPVRRRRRQPDPARREHHPRRRSTAPTCTPRSTSTSSGTPSGCSGRPSRTPVRTPASRSWCTPRPARSWPWPTTRRSTPPSRCSRPRRTSGRAR